ncbi:MAG: hypothetical protein HXX10_06725 [Rhodoplanes sp.]|uniref:hypothetical protein n=1 Tax=Rhodoplanes sp. TaxID=1968906 RepID=UPI00180CE676|nr:hypothetical protein [Rhodoplanes sp.]NVO13712.1 hypothetical protein [Rhodoplanes sp.]
MNKRLDEVLVRIKALPEEQQAEVAELLTDYVEASETGTWLTVDQVAEIERRLEGEPDYASEEEVRAVFDRLTK